MRRRAWEAKWACTRGPLRIWRSGPPQYKSKIEIERVGSGRRVDAKSVMGVMMLAAGEGVGIEVYAHGEDEAQALEALCRIIESKG